MQKQPYQAAKIVSTILKVLAVIMVVAVVIMAFQLYGQVIKSWAGPAQASPYAAPAIKGFAPRLMSLLQPLPNVMLLLLLPTFAWGIAEIISMLRCLAVAKCAAPAMAAAAPAVTKTQIKSIDEPKAE